MRATVGEKSPMTLDTKTLIALMSYVMQDFYINSIAQIALDEMGPGIVNAQELYPLHRLHATMGLFCPDHLAR